MYAVITEQDTVIASAEFVTSRGEERLAVAIDGDRAELVATFLWRTNEPGSGQFPEQWGVHWRGTVDACLSHFSDVAGDLALEQASFLAGS